MEVAVAAAVDTGGKLVDDHIDAGHVLPRDRAEVMPGTLTQSRVATLVLDHMSNVHDAVRAAPIADLLVKARTVELRGDVHVDVAGMGAVCLACPEAVQLGKPILAKRIVQATGKLVRPRQRQVGAPDKAAGRGVIERGALFVHKAGLVGKEAQDRFAKLVA